MTLPILLAVVGAIPATIIAILGYRASQKKDAIGEKMGIASAHSQTIEQVINAQTDLIESLRADNADGRAEIRALRMEVSGLRAEIRSLRDDLNGRLRV